MFSSLHDPDLVEHFNLLFGIFTFCLGAIFGSFANVVILRLPEGKSVVHPPSRCNDCGERVKWYDNIPILSWFILRGKCRSCKKPFSASRPLGIFTGHAHHMDVDVGPDQTEFSSSKSSADTT